MLMIQFLHRFRYNREMNLSLLKVLSSNLSNSKFNSSISSSSNLLRANLITKSKSMNLPYQNKLEGKMTKESRVLFLELMKD